MKPAWQAFWVSTATTVIVLGGGYAAGAAWTPAVDAGTMVLNTVFLPTGTRPTAVVDGARVAISWRASKGADDQPTLTYVVTREGGGSTTEACVVTTTNCRDVGVPAGVWTYTVRPDLGPWQGRDSPPGAPVTVTAGPEAAGQGGAPTPPGTRPTVEAPFASGGIPAVEAIGDKP
jgi:hypothetical protein